MRSGTPLAWAVNAGSIPAVGVPMDTQETLETIGELVDKINSLKVQIEDELS